MYSMPISDLMYVRIYASMHVCVYVCMYVCMYACVYVCILFRTYFSPTGLPQGSNTFSPQSLPIQMWAYSSPYPNIRFILRSSPCLMANS